MNWLDEYKYDPGNNWDSNPVPSNLNWSPTTDVYNVEGGLVIRVKIAGTRREDLQLKAEGNLLRISGVRTDQTRPSSSELLLQEMDFGDFETSIELPSGYDLDESRARYENGLLMIEVPVLSKKKHILIASIVGK